MTPGQPGLDLTALTAWLDAAHPGLRRGALRAELIPGGRSNLTYRLDDDRHRWVLRRPPLGHVLATAHDMGREVRVIRALRETAVPVPGAVLHCPDATVLGAPFYLMDRVEGVVLRGRDDLMRVPERNRPAVTTQLIDILATLHAIDPQAIGLADFGRPDGFLPRQLTRWSRQLAANRSREIPGIDALWDDLAASTPTAQRATVVHGDYRLDNLLIRPESWNVAAVLDWEMSTLGDPLTDLGLLLVYWGTDDGPASLAAVAQPPSGLVGFGPGSALAAEYAARTGQDISRLPWYIAFGYFKLAVILEGIHLRFTQGKTVGSGFDGIGTVVPTLVDAGHRALEGGR
jgi:aminoglycoside phosphotransferase (APT) family kinase protein